MSRSARCAASIRARSRACIDERVSARIARWSARKLHVGSTARVSHNLRADLGLVFALPPESIRRRAREGAGCYGQPAPTM